MHALEDDIKMDLRKQVIRMPTK